MTSQVFVMEECILLNIPFFLPMPICRPAPCFFSRSGVGRALAAQVSQNVTGVLRVAGLSRTPIAKEHISLGNCSKMPSITLPPEIIPLPHPGTH